MDFTGPRGAAPLIPVLLTAGTTGEGRFAFAGGALPLSFFLT